MWLFQCCLQCHLLRPGDASLGCWDQTSGVNVQPVHEAALKNHLFSAGDLKKPLGLRTPWFACSSSSRHTPGSTSSYHKQPRTTGSNTEWSRCHFGLPPPRNTFQNTSVCGGGCVCPVFYQDSFCFSLFSARLSAAFSSLAWTEFGPW